MRLERRIERLEHATGCGCPACGPRAPRRAIIRWEHEWDGAPVRCAECGGVDAQARVMLLAVVERRQPESFTTS